MGYTGTDPIADNWLTLVGDANGGTFIMIDPHNGQTAAALVGVANASPTAVHEGIDYWVHQPLIV
jgi:hypothetical protein